MIEPIVNVSDKDQIDKASKKLKTVRDQQVEDIRFLLGTPQGRRFFWRYLDECGVFKTSFTGNSQTFFLEGSRNIGLKLLSDINESAPESYLLMQKEAKIKND